MAKGPIVGVRIRRECEGSSLVKQVNRCSATCELCKGEGFYEEWIDPWEFFNECFADHIRNEANEIARDISMEAIRENVSRGSRIY